MHVPIKKDKRTMHITTITDADEVLCTTHEEIERAFKNYNHKLFMPEPPRGVDECLPVMTRKVAVGMNEELLKVFIVEEVNIALNQMKPLKALGPDGFAACFYQENWAIIGDDVCNAVLNFFTSSQLDGDINSIHIALFPIIIIIIIIIIIKPR
jgi:hypothetical protein